MNVAQRRRRINGTGGKVRTVVVPDRIKKTLQAEVKKHVEAGSAL